MCSFNMEEKRKFVRIDWPCVVQYKVLDEPSTQDQIIGKNISEGGISFTVYERLPKWTKLDMQIQIPFDSMPIFVKGKVVWINKVGGEQGKTFEEIQAQWYDRNYWTNLHGHTDEMDALIEEFNGRTGLLKEL